MDKGRQHSFGNFVVLTDLQAEGEEITDREELSLEEIDLWKESRL